MLRAEQKLKLDPLDGIALQEPVHLYMSVGRVEEAASLCERLVRLRPTEVGPLQSLGV